MNRSTRRPVHGPGASTMAGTAALCAGLWMATSAVAQTPAAAPSWQQGRSAEQNSSTLHPIAPILTGRPASELPLDKLKVPAGFKV